jgi:elongation factor Ts
LREKGVAAAAKRADRETSNGVVESYIHAGGRIGVLVEVNCETDFVANTDDFRALARNVAMQIAAMDPKLISPDERAGNTEYEGSDEEVCLLSQPFIRDPGRTIGQLVQDTVAKTGENVRVRRFVRFELGR